MNVGGFPAAEIVNMLTMRNDPASPLALTFKPIAAAIAPEPPASGCPGASTADATFPASSATEPSAAEGGLAVAPPIVAAAKTGALRENVPRRVAAARPSAPAAQGGAVSAAPVAILRRSKSPRGVAKAVPAHSAVLSQESVG